jgi:hypothetical protein
MTSIYSNMHTVNTITGLRVQLINQKDLSNETGSLINLDHTINKKYEVHGIVPPVGIPKIRYFGVGISGAYVEELEGVSGTDLDYLSPTSPYRPSAENLDIHKAIPLRVVRVDQEGGDTSLDDFRMRKVIEVDGIEYAAYYLKKITVFDGVDTQKVAVDTGLKTDYYSTQGDVYVTANHFNPDTLTPEELEAKLKKSTDYGEITHHIEVSYECEAIVTANDIQEYVLVLRDNNRRYAYISEVGFYSGEDMVVDVLNIDGQAVNAGSDLYTEAVGTQLCIHRCMTAIDLSNPGSTVRLPLVITNGSSVIAGDTVLTNTTP